MKKSVLFAALSAIFLSACGGGAPKCDDGSVVKKLNETFIQITKNSIAGAATGGALGMVDAIQQQNGYENLRKKAETDNESKKLLDEIDKAINAIKIDVADIRSNSVDDKTKKSVCQAQLKITGPDGSDTQNIQYSAQETASGLVVELVD